MILSIEQASGQHERELVRYLAKVILFVMVFGLTPVAAQDTGDEQVLPPVNYPGSEAKRVKPPAPGTRKRITVQITERYPAFPPPPVDYVRPTSVNPEDFRQVDRDAPESVKGARYGWYWGFVSPEIGASHSGRMQEAIAALYAGPEGQEIPGPRLQTIQNYVNAYGSDILRSTVGTRVSPALVMAVISVESAGNPTAVSHKGAQGLMQLMPATAKRFGVEDARSPAENIRGGVAYLDFLMEMFDRDPVLVLAAYNAGEGAVQRSGGVPRYAETRDYVPKVLAAWDVARGLCLTRPELATDGCVFRR